MKIRVVATPNPNAIEPPIASLLAGLTAAGVSGFEALTAISPLECEVGGADTPEQLTRVAAAVAELNAVFARWPRHAVGLRFETDTAIAEVPPPTASETPTSWTAEAAKLRDLNGSGAHAALPKVLAHGAPAKNGTASDTVVAKVRIGGREKWAAVGDDGAARFKGGHARRGAAIAVVESLRNLACAGAVPAWGRVSLGVKKSVSVEDLVKMKDAVCGVAEAAEYFNVPFETEMLESGEAASFKVRIAGTIEEEKFLTRPWVRAVGERLMLLGEAPAEIGASRYLRAVHGLEAGGVPAVDFTAEKKLQDVLRTLIEAGVALAAHDLSSGGLLVTICEMLFAPGRTHGAQVDLTSLGGARADALLFGESQGRVILTVAPDRVGTVLSEAHMRGVPAALIGEVGEPPFLDLKTRSLATRWSHEELRREGKAAPA